MGLTGAVGGIMVAVNTSRWGKEAVAAKEEALKAKDEALKAKDEAAKGVQAQLAAKDETAKALQAQLVQKDEVANVLRERIRGLEEQSPAKLRDTVTAIRAIFEEHATLVEEKAAREREELLEEHKRTIVSLETQLQAAEERSHLDTAEKQRLRAELDQVRSASRVLAEIEFPSTVDLGRFRELRAWTYRARQRTEELRAHQLEPTAPREEPESPP